MTVAENEAKLKCPVCDHEVLMSETRCNYCSSILKTLPQQMRTEFLQEFPGPKLHDHKVIRNAIYCTAVLNFGLGLIEGFWQNNSIAMVLNLLISLTFLAVSSRCSANPLAVIFFCVLINLTIHGLSHQLNLFSIIDLLYIKVLLLLIPFLPIRRALQARRLSQEKEDDWKDR